MHNVKIDIIFYNQINSISVHVHDYCYYYINSTLLKSISLSESTPSLSASVTGLMTTFGLTVVDVVEDVEVELVV